MTDAELFERERPRLHSIAYRMLGEHAGAEDVVQDAWLRWQGAGEVREPAAWLTTVTTRLAIDALKSARVKRESYVGPWLPEAEIAPWAEDHLPDARLEREGEVSLALLWAMERLAPEERAAFLLREAFDTDYADIAAVLEKTEEACRQLVSRAKRRVRQGPARFDADPIQVKSLLDRFMTATASLDRAEVLGLLSPDAVAISDGGGKVSAALRVLEGADEIAQVWHAIASKYGPPQDVRPVRANGLPALFVEDGTGHPSLITLVPDASGRVAWLYVLRNPEKLMHAKTLD